jgi:hypothetical protein
MTMTTNLQAVRYHDGERWCVGLMKVGHKQMHIAVIDDVGVRVVSEPKEMARHTEPLTRQGKPYPIERLVKGLKRVGRERGITQAALSMIEEVTA